mgnify:CR=1 FL=1
MRGQKGVTLTTLTIYIIVATIFLGTVAFININFMSELGQLTKRSKITNEMTKFYSFFVEDVKSAGKVLEYSDNYIKFDNGVQYSVTYRSNKESVGEQEYDVYEINRGSALITDKISGVFFDYNNEDKYIKVRLYYNDNDVIKNDEQFFKVGRGY